ncbi:MAG: GatB/YqeY domain-containing protein [Dehalococcoidia bacterium]
MSLVQTVRDDMTAAWRAGDSRRRDTLRLLIAALDYARIAAGHDLTDQEAIAALQREARQRRDSIEQYRAGGRQDLVDHEEAELAIIASYLPADLTDNELEALVREAIAEAGAAGPGDVGKVMGPLMKRVAGRAEGGRVNALVREMLASST